MDKEKIPRYINDPLINKITAPENKLYRPKINFGKAFGIMLMIIIATMAFSYIILIVINRSEHFIFKNYNQFWMWFSIYWRMQVIVLMLTLRYIFIWFIRIYQRYAKPETRLRCCYTPSCSEYAILALKKYGLVLGCYKAVNRLLRCGPPGGIDYP